MTHQNSHRATRSGPQARSHGISFTRLHVNSSEAQLKTCALQLAHTLHDARNSRKSVCEHGRSLGDAAPDGGSPCLTITPRIHQLGIPLSMPSRRRRETTKSFSRTIGSECSR